MQDLALQSPRPTTQPQPVERTMQPDLSSETTLNILHVEGSKFLLMISFDHTQNK